MKKLLIFLLLLPFMSVHAQEVFTWEPYQLSFPVPTGWNVQEQEDQLILTSATEPTLIAIQGITPDGPSTLESYRTSRDEVALAGLDTIPYPFITFSTGAYTGIRVLVSPYVLVTIAAPLENWQSDFAVEFIAQITTDPDLVVETPLLPFQWHQISLSIPAHWSMTNANSYHEILLTSWQDRMEYASTFAFGNLQIMITDYSNLRPFLTPDSVMHLRTLFYNPANILPQGDIEVINESDLLRATLNFTYESAQASGQAQLLMTPDHAYLIVGMAGSEAWTANQGALFETILQTLVVQR